MTLTHTASNQRTAGLPGYARIVPGVMLCVAVSAAAAGLQVLEIHFFGRAWLEALVLAILLGTALRTVWQPGAIWQAGIAFSAKMLLEIAVVLLGATISAGTILSAGPALLVGIALVVVVAICVSYGLGRVLGLPARMAVLIACGNSICGNSAIAAVAPVIGADSRDVTASIAFTAVLGVVVVLGLPYLAAALGMSEHSFGVFAGLTVYAVPQVLAATTQVGTLAAQVGTLVKLVRVLMLGPVVLFLSFAMRHFGAGNKAGSATATRKKLKLSQMVPWFIVGFLLAIAARSTDLLPHAVLPPASMAATWLTVVSMAALGLGVDVRVVARAGARVTTTVTLSLVALGAISLLLIHGLHV